ncbi:MAG: amidohydrolase family protein, partial [Bacteroidota bacterium]|nr:amidohydrolase family protein [Bacteroidota bacterium]
MKLTRLFFGLCLAALLSTCARHPRPTRLEIFDVVINHVTLVDVRTGQLTPNQVVAIAKGKIVEVQEADKDSYAAKQYVNGNGRYLIPGLWDMHVHFRGGDSLAAANKKSLTLYLAHGITTVRDAGGDLTPQIFAWRKEMEAGRLLPDQAVAVSGGKIARVGPENQEHYQARQTLDGTGRFLMPGLWDMHVHFRGGDSLAAANKKSLTLYLAHGITTVRECGGDLTPTIFKWRKEEAAGTLAGPRIFTSGPKIDGPGATWPGSLEVVTPADVSRALDSLQKMKVDFV